jgi:atlastin
MGSPGEPLKGFSWSSGTDRVTTGINAWSDVFLTKDQRTNEDIAIILMDTQGLFDNNTSKIDNSKIFSLSMMISSVQILNLSKIISEDKLEYLHFGMEFAKLCNAETSFQRFLFLIRDWENVDEHEFGLEGGKQYLQKVLSTKNKEGTDLSSVRDFLSTSVGSLDCCLLPHPGDIARRKIFKGEWGKLESEFQVELRKIVENIFNSRMLLIKKINDRGAEGSLVKQCIINYCDEFMSDRMPEPKTLFEATVTNVMNDLIEKSVSNFLEKLNGAANAESETDVENVLKVSEAAALAIFDDGKHIGRTAHYEKYRNQLLNRILEYKRSWKEQMVRNIKEKNERTKQHQEDKKKLEAETQELKRKIETEKLQSEREKREHEKEMALQAEKMKKMELEHEQKMKELEIQKVAIETLSKTASTLCEEVAKLD